MPLVCSIELSKEHGATITVQDDRGKVTQIVHLDGTTLKLQVKTASAQTTVEQKDASIITRVKQGNDESKISQTPTDIRIECQNFTVNAETIKATSNKDTTLAARGKSTISAQGDLTVKSSAQGTLQTSRDLTVKAGTKLNVSGGQKAALSAPQVALTSKMKTSVDGGAQLQMKAVKISARGQAQLEAAAPITNVGQSLTSLRGQLVKVDGALVKLG